MIRTMRMRVMGETSRFFRIAIALSSLWLVLFALAPNALLLLVAFFTRNDEHFVTPVLTLDNYIRLFDPTFLTILWDSARLACIATVICLLIGYPFAYIMANVRPNRRPFLLFLVIIPFWTSSLIRTYALILILKSKGLISELLTMLGITSGPVSFMYSDFAVFVGLTYTLLPFMILPLYASIEKLDRRLLDAAKDLGASSWRAFVHVTVPLTMPGIIAGAMLVFLPALSMFYVPEMLGGAKSMLLGNFIKNQFLVARDWPLGAAASSVMTIALILMVLVYSRVSRRGARNREASRGSGGALRSEGGMR